MNRFITLPASFVLLFCFYSVTSTGYAQTDTVVVYTPDTGEYIFQNISTPDTCISFANTKWNFGSYPGRSMLRLDPPDSVFAGAGFTDLEIAREYYPADSYPLRAAVKLFRTESDTLKQKCSGILVAKNYVLTACHCVGEFDTLHNIVFYDSLYVFPGYDNYEENPYFGSAGGVEYITFKSNLKGWYSKDIALIKLDRDIGTVTGWVGMAVARDNSYFEERVFHKFSYPGTSDPTDSTRVFDGEDMYYNYGTLDTINENWLGYYITGVPGQSGSSLLFTDNENYFTAGVMVWSVNSRHLRITPEIYSAFLPYLDESMDVENPSVTGPPEGYALNPAYPNPFNNSALIEYSVPERTFVRIVIYDILGNKIKIVEEAELNPGSYKSIIDLNGYAGGIYLCNMIAGRFNASRKMVYLK